MYAQVIIDANHAEVDRVFDYRVPAQWEEEVCVGLRVMAVSYTHLDVYKRQG